VISTSIFAASSSDAEAIGNAEEESRDAWESLDVDGLEQVRLATLLCIVCDEDWDDDVLDEFESLHAVSPQGPWIFLIPSRMTRGLAYMKDARAETVAKEWASTEELQRDANLDSSIEVFAEDCLAELRRLATIAGEDELELLLKISL